MQRSWTFAQYRRIDLTLFALILLLTESIIVTASTRWFPDQLYTVSVTGAVTAIVLMRWGAPALLHACLGSFVFCALSHGSLQHYLIYILGCVAVLLPWLLLKTLGHERVRQDAFLSVGLAVLTQLSLQGGRALVALCLGTAPRNCLGFFTTDTLSLLFAGVIVWIARRLDGVFEEQRHYLLRVQREV